MKEKTKLRVIQILCIVSLLITVFSIQKTYAKYFEQIDTNYATNIKKWRIAVNGKILRQQTSLSNVMTPTFFYNQHMDVNEGANDILVPGREGCFDFLIDYSKVDLPFKFAFDIEQLNTITTRDDITGEETEVENYLEDFEVFGYAIVDNDFEITGTTKLSDIPNIVELSKDANGKYNLSDITQEIDPTIDSDTEKQKRILVLFRWNDANRDTEDENTEPGMNNYEDTQYAGTAIEGDSLHTNLNYNVKIIFTQIARRNPS